MSCYRTVVNDHGTYRGLYNLSDDTLDILGSPTFEKRKRLSLRGIISSVTLRSSNISKQPGSHRFRVWLNKKSILTCSSYSLSADLMDQSSHLLRYEPLVASKQDAHQNRLLSTALSLRSTIRQWLTHPRQRPNNGSGSDSECMEEHSSNSDYSESTLADDFDFKLKLISTPDQKFNGPTAFT